MAPPIIRRQSSWQEDSIRQLARLNDDRLPRILSVSVGLAMAAFFIEPVATVLIVTLYILSEAAVPWLMSGYRENPTRRQLYGHLSLSFIGTSAYSANLVLLWNSPQPAVNLAAVAFLCGGLVHIATVNTHHLAMSLSKAIPLAAVTVYLPATIILGHEPDPAAAWFLIGTTAVLLGYTGQMILGLHRIDRELAAAHRDLAQASQAKSQFLATMSHGLRTPLNVVLGVARLLAARDGPACEMQLAKLEQAALSLGAIIDEALSAAEQGGAEQVLQPVSAHLHHSLAVTVAQMQETVRSRQITLLLDIDPALPEVAIYSPPMMSRLLRGLVEAALAQSCSAGQTTRVQARFVAPATGDADTGDFNLMLRVETNGTPPHAEKLIAALEPMVRKMGGRCFAEAQAGAAPAPVLLVPLKQAGRAAATRGDPTRVLVVDDIATNRFIAVQFLKAEQVIVAEAASGAAALAALAHHRFDLVLLDMNMPDMTGQQTFAAIRSSGETWSGVPVIALTANALGVNRQDYLSLGLAGFVAKPIDRAVMMVEINRVLTLARRAPVSA